MNINILLQNTMAFVVFVVLQIVLFNHVEITNIGVLPAFFTIFILLLPYETPDWLLISMAFVLGVAVDIFSDTMGLNSASTVFMAFLRPTILKSLSPRDGYETGTYPKIYYMGFIWFLKYAAIMVFIQQTVYYILADYNISLWIYSLMKIFIGSLVSIILITISQYIIFRK